MPPGTRLFLDTFFVQALLNARDSYHESAKLLFPRVMEAEEEVVTEAVLIEIGNALSGALRRSAAAFIRRCYSAANITVIPVDTPLLTRALELYENRSDKAWGPALSGCYERGCEHYG